MGSNMSRHFSSTPAALRRCAWFGMMAAHVPALVGTWRSLIADGFATEHLGGCVALSLAMLFFVLKLLGTAWLRFPVDRRAWVAMGMIVAMIHVDCIRANSDDAAARQLAVVVAVTILIADPMRVARALGAAFTNLRPTGADNPLACRAGHTVWLDLFLPHCWVLRFHCRIPRSPPLALHRSGLSW